MAVVAAPFGDGFGFGVSKYHWVGGRWVAVLDGDKLD